MEEGLDDLLNRAETRLSNQEEEISHAEKMSDAVLERISRIQLCQRMIRNIRMNMAMDDGSGLQMRFNQIRAVSEFIRFLELEGGEDFKGRFKQPTGAGKTILFGVITKLADVQTLVLVPRQNLLSNTKKEFMEMVGISEEDIGMVGAGAVELGKKITIATYQSHQRRMKTDDAYRSHVQQCDLIICDEAHRSLGDATKSSIDDIDETVSPIEEVDEEDEVTAEEEEYEQEVFADLEQSTNRKSLKLAFTATPVLSNKDVADNFPYLIAEEKQGDLVKAKILVPYRVIQVSASCETDDFEGYLTEEQEADVLNRENVYGKLSSSYAEALQRYKMEKLETDYPLYGVAFCVNIAECDKFAAEAEKYGLRSGIVTSREAKGKKGDDVIAQAERDLLAGEIDLIITVNKLGEGWNFRPANAAIWARASTSPMVVIQGVGRTCRTYTDEFGREKPYSSVFETQWSLRGYNRHDNKLHKKPLTIAQALALNGEDPSLVCSMDNGTPLIIDKFETLNDEGIAIVEGVEYVEAVRYMRNKMPVLTNYSIYTILGFYKDIRPVNPVHPIVLRGRIQECYLKSDIDRLLEEMNYVPPGGVVQINVQDEENEDKTRKIEAVHIPSYLKNKTDDPKKWLGYAINIGLKPIENVHGIYRQEGSKRKTTEVELYKKEEVDELFDKIRIPTPGQSGKKAFDQGVEIECAGGEKRIAVYVRVSSLIPASLLDDVKAEIAKKSLEPITYVVIGTNGRQMQMYWKEDIEAIVTEITNERTRKKTQEANERINKQRQAEQEKVVKQQEAKASRERLVEENSFLRMQPLETPGAYSLEYGFVDNHKPRTGGGKIVNLDEYVSPDLGRVLTDDERGIITNKLTTVNAGPYSRQLNRYYWQRVIDERIKERLLKKN